MKAVVIIGCGYIGRRVARQWLDNGVPVLALTRNVEHAADLRTLGVHPVSGDLDQPAQIVGLPLAGTIVYYFAPPAPVGHHDERIRAFLDLIGHDSPPTRIIYISTSGVYGDCHGAWVTEQTPPRPASPRAQRRLDAEQALRAYHAATAVPVTLLRVPAIYGPGRLPLERLRRGDPVLVEDQAPFTNRIHALDLARACVTLATESVPWGLFNVSDGQPLTMTEYFFRLADQFNLPRPPLITLDQARERLTPEMLSYWQESRRLDNRLLLEHLPAGLLYPDLDSGLRACLNQDYKSANSVSKH